MFSAYRNDKAQKNIISLNPTSGYAGSYALMVLCLFGIIGVLVMVSCIRKEPAPEPAAVAIAEPQLPADFCMVCHGPRHETPKIKSGADYKKAHPALSQKRLLQDLRSAL